MNAQTKLVKDWFAQQGFVAGARLPAERELAGVLGLSRPALREVLAGFEKDGLILRHVGRGTFLRRAVEDQRQEGEKPGADAVPAGPRDVWDARLMVEPVTAAAAARSARPDDLRAIRDAAARFEVADTVAERSRADRAFHGAVAAAAGNPVLEKLGEALWMAAGDPRAKVLAERQYRDNDAVEQSRREHRELCQAIEAADVEGAAEGARRHITREGGSLLVLLV